MRHTPLFPQPRSMLQTTNPRDLSLAGPTNSRMFPRYIQRWIRGVGAGLKGFPNLYLSSVILSLHVPTNYVNGCSIFWCIYFYSGLRSQLTSGTDQLISQWQCIHSVSMHVADPNPKTILTLILFALILSCISDTSQLSSWCMCFTEKSVKNILQHMAANDERGLYRGRKNAYARMIIVWKLGPHSDLHWTSPVSLSLILSCPDLFTRCWLSKNILKLITNISESSSEKHGQKISSFLVWIEIL